MPPIYPEVAQSSLKRRLWNLQLLFAGSILLLDAVSVFVIMFTNQCSLHHSVVCLIVFLSLVSYLSTQPISLASNGLSIALNEIPYHISPHAAGSVTVNLTALSKSASVNGFYPITVVQDVISSSGLPGLVKNFTLSDDVFQTAFAQGMAGLFLTRIEFPSC